MKLYRYLTGPDDASFCRRVTEALQNGWELYGNPTLTFDGEHIAGFRFCFSDGPDDGLRPSETRPHRTYTSETFLFQPVEPAGTGGTLYRQPLRRRRRFQLTARPLA